MAIFVVLTSKLEHH